MKTHQKLLATLLLATMPGAALAGCPSIDDRESGIVLAQNKPFFMRSDFTAAPQGFSERRVIEIDGQTSESMSLYRHGLVMVGEHSASGHVEIVYVDDLTPLADLPEKGEVSISGIVKGEGGDTYIELKLGYEGAGETTVGDCRYDTWRVRSRLMDRQGAGAVFLLDYAPAIDLVLAATQVLPDGSEVPAFAYQWAGTAQDFKR